jgi:NAD(P)-dependent dehydrogenase (short-subunit alcohol dehydrogenase family)
MQGSPEPVQTSTASPTTTATATAIVTGGTGGLGAAVTRRFLGASWRTVVPWYDENELPRLGGHPLLTLIRADLFDPASAAECAAAGAAEPAAPLSAVVNLVGGFAVGKRIHETPVEAFEEQLRLNVRPAYLTCQAALPHLIAAGGGSIVCVSSRAALRPFPGAAGYVTSKAAVLGLVDALAVEYRDDGIRANAVLPSVIDTPANRASMPDADHDRWVRPEQVAEVIFGLCAGSEAVSGARIPVYGRA